VIQQIRGGGGATEDRKHFFRGKAEREKGKKSISAPLRGSGGGLVKSMQGGGTMTRVDACCNTEGKKKGMAGGRQVSTS